MSKSPKNAATNEIVNEIDETPAATDDVLDRLDAHLPENATPSMRAPRMLVGLVTNDRHPTLRGRVQVRWTDAAGATFEKWMPALYAMPIRTNDRVLITQAENFEEPIVTGVIDGFALRPEVEKSAAAALEIKRDEVVRIDDSEGNPLLEVHSSDKGPVLKLLNEDVNLEVPGKFNVTAKSIRFEAKLGEARIEAHDDVIIKGENIKLN